MPDNPAPAPQGTVIERLIDGLLDKLIDKLLERLEATTEKKLPDFLAKAEHKIGKLLDKVF